MKKVGLVGGLSWVSTIEYYKLVNETVNEKLGGLDFCECLVYSLNFGELKRKGWLNAFDLLLNACKSLQDAKADAIALCVNTAHMYADELQQHLDIPIIHIVTETAKEIKRQQLTKVGLLGTKFTMEMPFYINKLEEHGVKAIIPPKKETREYIQYTLEEELGRGMMKPDTKQQYIAIANELIAEGAEGIILGCTEIPLLISPHDLPVPSFDTIKIHTDAIVAFALSRESVL